MKELALSPGGEAAWQALRHHLEWAEGWWVGWMYSDHPPTLRELERRVGGVYGGRRPLRSMEVRTSADVSTVLGELLRAGAGPGCVWIRCDGADPEARGAWRTLHARLNERRERLKRAAPAGLILAGPVAWKADTAAEAPDLWSVRSIALEAPAPTRSPSESLGSARLGDVAETGSAGPDPELATRAAARAEAKGSAREAARASVAAAVAWTEAGRPDLALTHAERARERLTEAPDADPVDRADALDALGVALRGLGRLAEARSAFAESLDVRRSLRALLGDQPGVLRDLSISLNNVGRVQRDLGELEGARSAFAESLDVCRSLRAQLGDQPGVLRDLAISVVNFVVVGEPPGDRAALAAEGIAAAEAYAARTEDPRAAEFLDWVRGALTTAAPPPLG